MKARKVPGSSRHHEGCDQFPLEIAAPAGAHPRLRWKQVSNAEDADEYFRFAGPRQPHRRLGLAAVATAGEPIRAGKGGGESLPPGTPSAKFRGHPIGLAFASFRSILSFGMIVRSACTTAWSLSAPGQTDQPWSKHSAYIRRSPK